jgi:hypothetical protein
MPNWNRSLSESTLLEIGITIFSKNWGCKRCRNFQCGSIRTAQLNPGFQAQKANSRNNQACAARARTSFRTTDAQFFLPATAVIKVASAVQHSWQRS